ncbi:hypothetical protein C8Q77DRAFT_1159151 [Trametes polyzona]|nr:hypothetical protein C8Q77DRAFT_1159151 [Trametes polyzona]
MIVAKDSQPSQPVDVEKGPSSPAGASASASASSPPLVVLSPPPAEQTSPTQATGVAPPAYSFLPSAAATGVSTDHELVNTVPSAQPPMGHSGSHRRHTSSSEYSDRDNREHSAWRACSRGLFMMVIAPIAAFLAALYGAGKMVEGIGKGLSMGPEAAYRAYKKSEERDMERQGRSKKAGSSSPV